MADDCAVVTGCLALCAFGESTGDEAILVATGVAFIDGAIAVIIASVASFGGEGCDFLCAERPLAACTVLNPEGADARTTVEIRTGDFIAARGACVTLTGERFVDLAVAIVVEVVAELRLGCAKLCVAHHAAAVLSADVLSFSAADALSCFANFIEIGKVFIDLAIAIVIKAVAAFLRLRRASLCAAFDVFSIVATDKFAGIFADTATYLTGIAFGWPIFIDHAIAVVVFAIADLGLGQDLIDARAKTRSVVETGLGASFTLANALGGGIAVVTFAGCLGFADGTFLGVGTAFVALFAGFAG